MQLIIILIFMLGFLHSCDTELRSVGPEDFGSGSFLRRLSAGLFWIVIGSLAA